MWVCDSQAKTCDIRYLLLYKVTKNECNNSNIAAHTVALLLSYIVVHHFLTFGFWHDQPV